MVTKQQHLNDLRKHDWSYMMSDDGSVYRRGSAQEAALILAEKGRRDLEGMYETYREWWWSMKDGKPNVIGSGKGRSSGEPEPTFGVEQ